MGTFACDVSEWQYPVDDRYTRQWLIFRGVNDGGRLDFAFQKNLAWSRKACADGRMAGYTVYVVYRPGLHGQVIPLIKSAIGVPDEHLTIMIDVESWGGQIAGDHSLDIENNWCIPLRNWLRDGRRVFGYGNSGDLATIWPSRYGCKVIRASYGPNAPASDWLGWQYTDGRPDLYGAPENYPTVTAPFGACDHNYFNMTPQELAANLGVDMALTDDDKAWIKSTIADVVTNQVMNYVVGYLGGVGNSRFPGALGKDYSVANQKGVALNPAALDQITHIVTSSVNTGGVTPEAIAQAIKLAFSSYEFNVKVVDEPSP